MKQQLGQMAQVELREVWTTEASEFTPWLAGDENLALLGDAIGMELELEAQEQSVGPFRADILCKDTANGTWVLIENQLAKTDHVHLGQILTYAAGLKAVTIVWIAQRFTEEHRAALDWLNEITGDDISFFGLEIELWRIGNSPVAPKFNVVCKPNDWTKPGGAGTIGKSELTDAKRLQLDFWTAFHEYVVEHGRRIKPHKASPQHWMSLALGRTGAHLSAVASMYDSQVGSYDTNELRAEVVLDGPHAKVWFKALNSERAAIEAEIDEPMTWHDPVEKRMCRVYVRRAADLNDRGKWTEYFAWLLDRLERLHDAFGDRVKKLPNTIAAVGAAD